jgi:hypothetical protein
MGMNRSERDRWFEMLLSGGVKVEWEGGDYHDQSWLLTYPNGVKYRIRTRKANTLIPQACM